MNWTVSRRIFVGYAGAMLLVLGITLVGAWALDRSSAAFEAVLLEDQEALLTAFDGRGALRNANNAYLRYMIEGDEENAEARRAAVAVARSDLRALRDAAETPELRQAWSEALGLLDRWDDATARAIAAARAGNAQAALQLRLDEVRPLQTAVDEAFERGISTQSTRTTTEIRAAQDRADAAETVLWTGFALVLLLAIVSGMLLNRSITRPLQESSGVLATSAAEIAATTSQQASGATESLAAVTETAATVDQVVQTAEHATERARAVASSARRAVEVGREGRTAVDGSVAAMDAVREQVESIANRILALAEQAQAIGEIISTVNELAERTNLLALNAAIEAARAGEQGKGFAVVASEVKDLAEQSKSATVRVRDILGDIQRATSAAVMATEEGSKQVTEGMRQVSEAGERIRALSQVIDEASQAAAQIAASASQQSTGMAQVRQAISNIQQAAQQNLAATKESEAASQELQRLGRDLIALVGSSNGRQAQLG